MKKNNCDIIEKGLQRVPINTCEFALSQKKNLDKIQV